MLHLCYKYCEYAVITSLLLFVKENMKIYDTLSFTGPHIVFFFSFYKKITQSNLGLKIKQQLGVSV
jgi:hypothetical protein